MFTVHQYNFGNVRDFATFAEAEAFTRRCCFEATISKDNEWVARYSPITGFQRLGTFREYEAAEQQRLFD